MILAVDTSAVLGLVSLEYPDGRRLGRSSDRPRDHAEFLAATLAGFSVDENVSWSEIDRVGIALGPGSFTGLRVGLATVKGLVFAGNIPVAPIDSLAVPVLAARSQLSTLICRKARGEESWAACFAAGSKRPAWEKLLEADAVAAAARDLLAAHSDGVIMGALPASIADEFADANRAEPDAAAQLDALADLARDAEKLVSGPELDRLLPRYMLDPAVTLPDKKKDAR